MPDDLMSGSFKSEVDASDAREEGANLHTFSR